MKNFTTPETYDELTATIARQIGPATHGNLDRESAPVLGGWKRFGSFDDYYPTPCWDGARPVGWVKVDTKKRGIVLVWCEGWRNYGRTYAAVIVWPTEYQHMSSSELAIEREREIERADSGLRMGLRHSSPAIGKITDEQRRRIVAQLISAGTEAH